jgi:hypothetical protein
MLSKPLTMMRHSPGQSATRVPADQDCNREAAPSPPRSNGQAFDEARNPVTVADTRHRCKASARVRPRWDQAFPCYSPLGSAVGAGPSAVCMTVRLRHNSGVPFARCPPPSRGHPTFWGGRRRGGARGVRRQTRPTGAGTGHTHRVSARRIGWLRPDWRGERKRGNHRDAAQEMLRFHL